MCTGVEYVSHEDYYNPKRTAAPVRTSGDGDGGGTVGNGYSTKPLNATGIGKNGNTYTTRNDGKKTFKSGSTITNVTPSTSRSTGLGFGGKYESGGLY